MVALCMFRSREFSGGTATMMIWAFGVLGIHFFTSLYLQQTLGFSPVKAAPAFVPMAPCVAVFAALAPQAQARAGAHRTVAFGLLLMVVGLVLFARLGLHASYASLLPVTCLDGRRRSAAHLPSEPAPAPGRDRPALLTVPPCSRDGRDGRAARAEIHGGQPEGRGHRRVPGRTLVVPAQSQPPSRRPSSRPAERLTSRRRPAHGRTPDAGPTPDPAAGMTAGDPGLARS